MSAPDRRALLDHDHDKLSMRRQCTLLGVARSGVYRQRRPANNNDLAMMRRLDELFTAWPFLGSRRMAAMLRTEGHRINRKRVHRMITPERKPSNHDFRRPCRHHRACGQRISDDAIIDLSK